MKRHIPRPPATGPALRGKHVKPAIPVSRTKKGRSGSMLRPLILVRTADAAQSKRLLLVQPD